MKPVFKPTEIEPRYAYQKKVVDSSGTLAICPVANSCLERGTFRHSACSCQPEPSAKPKPKPYIFKSPSECLMWRLDRVVDWKRGRAGCTPPATCSHYAHMILQDLLSTVFRKHGDCQGQMQGS